MESKIFPSIKKTIYSKKKMVSKIKKNRSKYSLGYKDENNSKIKTQKTRLNVTIVAKYTERTAIGNYV